ncbi:hypothetical protein D9619_003863 [Psilocybe cf. subviscida]|uniref:Uncharacterized protein n=1 Tax=Psilocybe cf. subviscida TaxID=2480587 RepID=A0A8H5AWP9_9AGAR|nr:hypothetical protein D9619_003863 [Psilocybe cf. subviscida]
MSRGTSPHTVCLACVDDRALFSNVVAPSNAFDVTEGATSSARSRTTTCQRKLFRAQRPRLHPRHGESVGGSVPETDGATHAPAPESLCYEVTLAHFRLTNVYLFDHFVDIKLIPYMVFMGNCPGLRVADAKMPYRTDHEIVKDGETQLTLISDGKLLVLEQRPRCTYLTPVLARPDAGFTQFDSPPFASTFAYFPGRYSLEPTRLAPGHLLGSLAFSTPTRPRFHPLARRTATEMDHNIHLGLTNTARHGPQSALIFVLIPDIDALDLHTYNKAGEIRVIYVETTPSCRISIPQTLHTLRSWM